MGGSAIDMERPTGVMVIRVWLEDGVADAALRARLTQTLDVANPQEHETAAASEQEILATVESWLRDFLASAGSQPA